MSDPNPTFSPPFISMTGSEPSNVESLLSLANSLEGSRPPSSASVLDPRGGTVMVNMNGVAPATVKELTVSTIETLKMQYENYVRQNPVGQVQHPHVYLASEPRRMLASICRWLKKDDYSDWEKLRVVSPTEWFKQVLLMLKKQFGSEKEEGNLTLKTLSNYVGWAQQLTKYFEEAANLTDNSALTFTLECLENFEKERKLLRSAMNTKASNGEGWNKDDIIGEVLSILHVAKLYDNSDRDRKRPADEKYQGQPLKRNKGNHPMNSSHSDLGKRDIRQTERRYDQRDYRREDRKDHSRETYYRRNDSHRQNDRDKEKTDDRKTYYQRDFQKKVPYQNRRESSSEDRTKEVKETKKNDSK